jgi:TonB family protein
MVVTALVVFALTASHASQVSQTSQTSQGQRIQARDGDVIVADIGATLRVVRHAEGQARVVYNAAGRWLIVLLDHTGPNGTPDGFVDASYFFRDVQSWPLAERWDGAAAVDEYSMAGDPLTGLGLKTPDAFVQLITSIGPSRGSAFADPSATVVAFGGFGRGSRSMVGFDVAEQRQIASLMRPPPPGRTTPPAVTYGVRSESQLPAPLAPVRVGGNIRQPAKIADVRPVLPAEAAQAGIRGVVILEITVGVDGSVTDAKVLRSIPLLDQAALDAVRQWRYEVTHLNGQPVPVIMTVTAAFQ